MQSLNWGSRIVWHSIAKDCFALYNITCFLHRHAVHVDYSYLDLSYLIYYFLFLLHSGEIKIFKVRGLCLVGSGRARLVEITEIKLMLQYTGSQRPHRCCLLANKIENIDYRHVYARPSMTPNKISSFRRGSWPARNKRFLGHSTNGISIDSAVLVQLAFVTNEETDRQTTLHR